MHPYESHTCIFVVAAKAQQDHQTRNKLKASGRSKGTAASWDELQAKAKKSAEQEVLEKIKRAETRKRRNEEKKVARQGGGVRKAERRGRPQPTAGLLKKGLEDMLSKFIGFDSSTDNVEERIAQYCEIKVQRYKAAVQGGLKPFIKGNDFSFLIDTLRPLSEKKRRNVIKQVCAKLLGQDAHRIVFSCEATKPACHSSHTCVHADAPLLHQGRDGGAG